VVKGLKGEQKEKLVAAVKAKMLKISMRWKINMIDFY